MIKPYSLSDLVQMTNEVTASQLNTGKMTRSTETMAEREARVEKETDEVVARVSQMTEAQLLDYMLDEHTDPLEYDPLCDHDAAERILGAVDARRAYLRAPDLTRGAGVAVRYGDLTTEEKFRVKERVSPPGSWADVHPDAMIAPELFAALDPGTSAQNERQTRPTPPDTGTE